MRLYLMILCFLPALVLANEEYGKKRDVEIKAFTSDVVAIPLGRSVKLLFPWQLDEYDKELPLKIDLPDEGVFTFDFPKGQNFIRVSYNVKGAELVGEKTDLHISTHGYHLSILLKSVPLKKEHYSLVSYHLSDGEKIEFLAREKRKIRDAINREYLAKYEELEKESEYKALSLLGELSISNRTKENVYVEGGIEDHAGDDLILYVDHAFIYGHIYVFPFEIKNKTNQGVHITSLNFYQSDKTEEANTVSIVYAMHHPKKIGSYKTGHGYVVTNDPDFSQSMTNNLELNTDYGSIEVNW